MLQSTKDLDSLLIVWGAETGNRIPASDSREAIVATCTRLVVAVGAAQALVTLGDVVEDLRVLIDGRVDEAEGLLAGGDALLVDAREDGSDEGRRLGCATRGLVAALDDESSVVTNGGEIGVAAAGAVVDAAGLGNLAVAGGVGLVPGVVLAEVVRDGRLLVVGRFVDVAEAAARRERGGDNLGLLVGDGAALGDGGGADHGKVGAAAGVVGDENVLLLAQAGTAAVGNAVVAAGDEERDTLKTELHELVALTLTIASQSPAHI